MTIHQSACWWVEAPNANTTGCVQSAYNSAYNILSCTHKTLRLQLRAVLGVKGKC